MKASILIIVMLILFTMFLIGFRPAEFTVAWDPNTEPDMSHYNLYRYSQGNYQKKNYQKINDAPIMHPTTRYKFTLKLSDDSIEKLCFVVTAVDTSRNESNYSEPVCIEK